MTQSLVAVERTIEIAASPEEVWEALTRSELLEAWLGDEVTLEPWDGGDVHVQSDGDERRGTVEYAESPERLVLRWWDTTDFAVTTVEFRIVARPDGGARLVVIETPTVTTPTAAMVDWSPRLVRLGSAVTCLAV